MEFVSECKTLSLELMQTLDEGVAYIIQMFERNNFDAGYGMIYDVAQAIYTVNNTIRTMSDTHAQGDTHFKLEQIQNIINDILFGMDQEETEKIITKFDKCFLPEYFAWRNDTFKIFDYSEINH